MPAKKIKMKKKPKKIVLKKRGLKKKTAPKTSKKQTARKSSVSKKTIRKKSAPKKATSKKTKKQLKKRKNSKLKKTISKLKAKPVLKNQILSEPDIESLIRKKQKNKGTKKPKIEPAIIYRQSRPKMSPHIIDLKGRTEVIDKKTDCQPDNLDVLSEFEAVKLTETEVKDQFTKGSLFVLPLRWKRAVGIFIIISLIIAGPIQAFSHFYKLNKTKDQVLSLTHEAYSDLKIAGSAVSDKDLYSAQEHFSQANKNFINAQNQLGDISILLQPILKIVPYEGKTLSDAENLLIIGQNISTLGEKISEVFNYFYQDSSAITDKILHVQTQIRELLPIVENSTERIENINPKAIPSEFEDQFAMLKGQVHQFNKDFHTLDSFAEFLLSVLGHEKKKRYLFIFQNNSELRPTGGFMGSLALVDLNKGEIKNIEVPGGGPYDFKGTLYERLEPPQPLLLVNDIWQLQDSNWFYNFPDSAEKIQWFYQKAGGPTVDGIIAINATLIEELLKYLPPIEMPEYRKIITADNFINDTQKVVELEYDREENKPKKFIGDLAPKLLESIFNAKEEDLSNIVKTLNQSFAKKEILVYLNDSDLQKKVTEYNWAGEVKDSSKDYLSIVAVNILGGKTDHVMFQNAKLETNIDQNGYITNTLTISRKHLGDPTSVFESLTNNTYLKIFVPLGSKLLSAQGFSEIDQAKFYKPAFNTKTDEYLNKKIRLIDKDPISKTEILQEANKTVFANWVITPVGQTNEIKISYILPFQINMPEKQNQLRQMYNYLFNQKSESEFYSIFIQKHPGALNNHIQTTVQLPPKYKISWIYPSSASLRTNNIGVYEADITTDQLFGLIFEQ